MLFVSNEKISDIYEILDKASNYYDTKLFELVDETIEKFNIVLSSDFLTDEERFYIEMSRDYVEDALVEEKESSDQDGYILHDGIERSMTC